MQQVKIEKKSCDLCRIERSPYKYGLCTREINLGGGGVAAEKDSTHSLATRNNTSAYLNVLRLLNKNRIPSSHWNKAPLENSSQKEFHCKELNGRSAGLPYPFLWEWNHLVKIAIYLTHFSRKWRISKKDIRFKGTLFKLCGRLNFSVFRMAKNLEPESIPNSQNIQHRSRTALFEMNSFLIGQLRLTTLYR